MKKFITTFLLFINIGLPVFGQDYSLNTNLIPFKIAFSNFFLKFHSDNSNKVIWDDQNAGLQTDRFEHTVNYTLYCRKRISISKLTKKMKIISKLVSPYIKSADTNITNTKHFRVEVGIYKNDKGYFFQSHLLYILSTDTYQVLRMFSQYSLNDKDTTLKYLYDDRYVTKKTGKIKEQRIKGYKATANKIDSCSLSMVPPLISEVDDNYNETTHKQQIKDHAERLKGEFRKQCFEENLPFIFNLKIRNNQLKNFLFFESIRFYY